METHVCSNCGQVCNYDGRCGDGPYLVCACATPENTRWVDDGRGGYMTYLNDAHPVSWHEYEKKRYPNPRSEKWDNWGREDD